MLHSKNRECEKSQIGRNGMAPRAFRAKTMTAALAAVEKALGNEALIVAVHPSPPKPAWQLWRQTGVEVVAMPSAVARSTESEPASPSAEPAVYPDSQKSERAPQPVSSPPAGSPTDETVGSRTRSVATARPPDPGYAEFPLPLAALSDRLRAQGVEDAWLRKMIRSIRDRSNPMTLEDAALARELVRQELCANLRSDCGACLLQNRVIGIVGVSGSGKTSACAKIAAYAFKALGKRVHWVSADTLRAGAIAKAQAFTAPLGIPLHLAYRPEALASFLQWNSDSDLFLIDTPGCNPYRKEDLAELRALFAELPERHLLLAVPATGKETDLQDIYRAYAGLGIGGLVVTKLDETRSYGGLFNFLRKSQLPVSFLIDGVPIYGDPHAGDIALLADRLLSERTD